MRGQLDVYSISASSRAMKDCRRREDAVTDPPGLPEGKQRVTGSGEAERG